MTSPYLTTREVAVICRIEKKDGSPDINETLRFLRLYQIATVKRGRTVLVDRDDLFAHLNRQQRVLQSHASRFQQSSRSLHGAGVSGQLISERHAPEVSEALSGSPLNRVAKEAHQ